MLKGWQTLQATTNETDKRVSHKCKDHVHVSTLIKIVPETHLWLTSDFWVFQPLSCDRQLITTILNLNNNLIRLVHGVIHMVTMISCTKRSWIRDRANHCYCDIQYHDVISWNTPILSHQHIVCIIWAMIVFLLWSKYFHSIVWVTLWFPVLIQILSTLVCKNPILPWLP